MSSAVAIPDVEIRLVTSTDLEEILVHRRRMFEDMGHRDVGVLDAIVCSSRPVLKDFLADGSYVGWFATTREGRVAAGAGLLISPSLAGPLSPERADRAYLWNVLHLPRIPKARFSPTAHTKVNRLLPSARPPSSVAACQRIRKANLRIARFSIDE